MLKKIEPYPVSYLVSGDYFKRLFGSSFFEVIENDMDNKCVYYKFMDVNDSDIYILDYSERDSFVRLYEYHQKPCDCMYCNSFIRAVKYEKKEVFNA